MQSIGDALPVLLRQQGNIDHIYIRNQLARLDHMNSRTLWKRLCTIGSWTLVSRVLGLIRDRVMGATFGASLILDAFYVAFALPNMVRNLFGEGALSSAFIPRYAQLRERDPKAAEAFAGLVLTRLSILLSILAALGMLVTGLLMLFSKDNKVILVAVLAFAQLPYLVFICVSAIMAGVLQTRRHFSVPAASPIILNICMIIAVMVWSDVYFLPYAILCSGILQLVLHVMALKFCNGVPPLSWTATKELGDMRRALIPTIVGASVYQINAFIDAIIAYKFLDDATGAVVILYFANRLLQFPLALIAHSVGTAAYPDMSRVASGGYAATGTFLGQVNRVLLALVVPAGVGLFLVAEPLARCIYQAGAFGSESVMRVVVVTQIYAFGLLPIALSKILVRSFHAHLDQRTPMNIGLCGVFLNLGLNIIFVLFTNMAEGGLALASVISSVVMCLWYMLLLRRRGAGSVIVLKPLLSVLSATTIMGCAVYLLRYVWVLSERSPTLHHLIYLFICVVLGGLVYGGLLYRSIKRWRKDL